MPYSSLVSFIKTLEENGELIRIKEFVSPMLEITEITDRISKAGGKALLFENTGTQFPVLINSLGSENRICLALGIQHLDEISERILEFAGNIMQPRESFLNKLALLPTLAGVASWMPKRIKDSLIAATALVHGFIVVTRNTRDFRKAGVKTLDPFT